ncbi:hypothetical protein ACOCJ7_17795 [Knoellia sp. CPCC 206453]|uniref:hypothetical protein n=1 Tax=Knoellia pratensis TaxID=3404796 RepID=UPI0036214C78
MSSSGRPADDDKMRRRAAKARRREASADKRELVQAVSKAMFRADPVGINFETNTDEYDPEAETLVIALPETKGPEDVMVLTHQCFVEWFDEETAGPPSRYTAVAEEIWDLWQRHTQHGR